MTPAEYVEAVVLPTVRDFMARPDDRRLAYLSAIATFHVTDYLMRAAKPPTEQAGRAELKRIRDLLRADATYFYDAIDGLCNGTKHCGRDNKRGLQFKPGGELYVPKYGTSKTTEGWDHGKWDGPGLVVMVGSERVFVDHALPAFLLTCQRHFPQHISGLWRASWMP